MLVAKNTGRVRKVAFETDKHEKPFFCPACSKEVILKKGNVREHHFAHVPGTDCIYGKGESQLHYRVKREIYQALKNHPNCSKCEPERVLKGVRPDISLMIDKTYVAIEVQHTAISIEEINKRSECYTNLGIHLVWVFTQDKPKIFLHGKYDDEVSRIKNWEQHIHQIQNDRVYYWSHGACVIPYHYGSYYTYKTESSVYDSYGDEQSHGGYWEEKKLLKVPLPYPEGEFHIADSFKPDLRIFKNKRENNFPRKCKIFVDDSASWWERHDELNRKLITDSFEI
jgi:competence protein CoiA